MGLWGPGRDTSLDEAGLLILGANVFRMVLHLCPTSPSRGLRGVHTGETITGEIGPCRCMW